jgi:hypothetical protein
MAVCYVRSGETVTPETRFSVYYAGALDISPSQLLRSGNFPLISQNPKVPIVGRIDMTGICVDPYDDEGIWMINPYASTPADPNNPNKNYKLVVGRVFGTNRVDLKVAVRFVGTIAPGVAFRLDSNVRNQGTDASDGSHIAVSFRDGGEGDGGGASQILAEMDIPPLAPADEVDFEIPVTVPAGLPPGDYMLSVAVDPDGTLEEYSKENNVHQIAVNIPSEGGFQRGDCNDDGNVDISDAVCILSWLFLGEDAPGCLAATNANGDVGTDLSDAVYLLTHLFLGGPAPVDPFPECGPGRLPTDEEMGCGTPPTNCS